MTPITIGLDALPATLPDCVSLYRRVGQVADDCRGAILKHVRDEKLYRQGGHKTFEAFVDAEFGVSRIRAYQLISDFDVRQNVKNSLHQPRNVGQTAELAKLPPEQQADAWEEVVAESESTGEKITAKKVEKVVARRIAAIGIHLKISDLFRDIPINALVLTYTPRYTTGVP